jgi:hypothetical protein
VDRADVEPRAGDQPGDHRVRVPHLARAELVAAPHRRRHLGDEREQPSRRDLIVAEALRPVDRLRGVGDDAVAPATDLVAKEPEDAGYATADRPLGDDAAFVAVAPWDRRHLDHEPPLRYTHLECGVVQVTAFSPPEPSRNPLEDTPVEPNDVTARAQRQPVEVDARDLHRLLRPVLPRRRHDSIRVATETGADFPRPGRAGAFYRSSLASLSRRY